MRRPFVAIEIGCIECQETTYFRGTFRTREEARAAFQRHNDTLGIQEASAYASRRQMIFDLRDPTPIGEFPE